MNDRSYCLVTTNDVELTIQSTDEKGWATIEQTNMFGVNHQPSQWMEAMDDDGMLAGEDTL